jgi:hypothetical protein
MVVLAAKTGRPVCLVPHIAVKISRWLASLSTSDAVLLAPILKPVRLKQQKVLFEMGGESVLSGDGLQCDADAFKAAVLKSPSLLSTIIRHEQTVYAQAQQSAACIATHNVESRLARWLMRSRDLAATETLPFTQEFLGEMLGVRRTSVSLVAHTLQQAGMIEYIRGKIQIINAETPSDTACECAENRQSFQFRRHPIATEQCR